MFYFEPGRSSSLVELTAFEVSSLSIMPHYFPSYFDIKLSVWFLEHYLQFFLCAVATYYESGSYMMLIAVNSVTLCVLYCITSVYCRDFKGTYFKTHSCMCLLQGGGELYLCVRILVLVQLERLSTWIIQTSFWWKVRKSEVSTQCNGFVWYHLWNLQSLLTKTSFPSMDG